VIPCSPSSRRWRDLGCQDGPDDRAPRPATRRLSLTGLATIFEGHRGVFGLFAGAEGADIRDAARQRWQVLDRIFRFYPAVDTVHGPLDAIRYLRESASLDPR
jgi:2-methylcitrate dehydratase PrpD